MYMVLARMSLCVNIVCDAGIYAISFRNFFFSVGEYEDFLNQTRNSMRREREEKEEEEVLTTYVRSVDYELGINWTGCQVGISGNATRTQHAFVVYATQVRVRV